MLDEFFNLVGKLGYGEFGEVWKGEQRGEDSTPVAIKIFKKTCKDRILFDNIIRL